MEKAMKWVALVLFGTCLVLAARNMDSKKTIMLQERVTTLSSELEDMERRTGNLANNLAGVNNLLVEDSPLISQINEVLLFNGYASLRRMKDSKKEENLMKAHNNEIKE
jgi:hypothetical protein